MRNVEVTGGGDDPESVYDAFFEVNKMDFWRSDRKRMIVLVGDAPPLEKPLSDYTLNDVIKAAKSGSIEMNFYPIIVSPYDITEVKHPVAEFKDTALISKMYPNPTNGMLNVAFTANNSYEIGVYSASGNSVYRESFTGDNWQHDFNSLPDGVYVLQAVSKDKLVGAERFLVRH